MMLDGRRILVLQSEYLIAIDLQAVLESEGAVVTIGLPHSDTGETFDCFLIDSKSADHPVTTRLNAEGVPLVVYTGHREAVRDRFPEAVIVGKPAPDQAVTAGVERALHAQRVHAHCA